MPKRIEKFCKLRGRMAEKSFTGEELALSVGLSRNGISLKLVGANAFTLPEAYKIMSVLEIPAEQMHEYFPANG